MKEEPIQKQQIQNNEQQQHINKQQTDNKISPEDKDKGPAKQQKPEEDEWHSSCVEQIMGCILCPICCLRKQEKQQIKKKAADSLCWYIAVVSLVFIVVYNIVSFFVLKYVRCAAFLNANPHFLRNQCPECVFLDFYHLPSP